MSNSDYHAAGFAARYRKMTDGELLKLAAQASTLSDLAWEALEEELDRRQLELPEDEPAVDTVLQKKDLIMLKRFRDLPEAMLAKGKLSSEAVESYLADDNTVRMDWLLSNLLGGVKLFVGSTDRDSALRILDEPIPEEIDFEGTTEYQQPRCPRCLSLDVNFQELYRPIAYGSLFVNFPIPLRRKGWICQTCRHTWEEEPTKAGPWTIDPTS